MLGHLAGGFESWQREGKETDTVNRITAAQFATEVKFPESQIIDVRKESEYAAMHIEGSSSKPLAYINEWAQQLDASQHFYLHCAGGYRSMMAASILKARGVHNFSEIEGGFGAISKIEVIPVTAFVCPSTLK